MRLSTDEKIRAGFMVDYGRREEHLQGRIALEGFDSLSQAEQVEFLLYYYRPKKGLDVKALSERLVEKYGDLASVVMLSEKELRQVEGMYPALAKRFTGFRRLTRKFVEYERKYQRIYIRNMIELCRHLLPLYRVCRYPGTWQLCLSDDFEVIYEREIAPSRAWGEEGYMKEGLFDAEMTDARYVIVVQMCGREWAQPAPYDEKHAKIYAERLEKIGCSLLDVVLIDEGRLTSMYESGMIKPGGKRIGRNAADRQEYFNEEKYLKELRLKK